MACNTKQLLINLDLCVFLSYFNAQKIVNIFLTEYLIFIALLKQKKIKVLVTAMPQ
jgi:hypothetical protein